MTNETCHVIYMPQGSVVFIPVLDQWVAAKCIQRHFFCRLDILQCDGSRDSLVMHPQPLLELTFKALSFQAARG